MRETYEQKHLTNLRSSTSIYPSKKEILAHPISHTAADSKTLERWKKEHYTKKWKSLSSQEKLLNLAWLAVSLAPGVNIKKGTLWATQLEGPQAPQIIMDESNPSIISLLHEVGHVMLGRSELLACAYSVKLFTEIFPTEYKSLVWRGHMLRKHENT